MSDVIVVSACNNYEVGKMIVEAMIKVGRKGIVTLEEGKSLENSLYVVEGIQFDHGYISPYFVTESEKMTVEFENCKLLLVGKKITNASNLIAVLEEDIRGGYLILIMVEDIEQGDLVSLAVNKLRGGEVGLSLEKAKNEVLGHAAKVVFTREVTTIVGNGSTQDVVNKRFSDPKPYREQDYEKEKLNERIAKLFGGIAVIQRQLEGAIRTCTMYIRFRSDCVDEIDAQRVLGYALFKDGKNAKLSYPLEKFDSDVSGEEFSQWMFHTAVRLEQGTVTYLLEENGKSNTRTRLGRKEKHMFLCLLLVTDAFQICDVRFVALRYLESVYILRKVGAQTETELKEKKLKVEDVLNATKAAVEEGIVVGGGCTLLRLAAKVGSDIFKSTLSYPLKLSVVMEKVLSSYNAATGKYEDLMATSIIDPTKMSMSAIPSMDTAIELAQKAKQFLEKANRISNFGQSPNRRVGFTHHENDPSVSNEHNDNPSFLPFSTTESNEITPSNGYDVERCDGDEGSKCLILRKLLFI
ncbi:hypothetical protein GIB67_032288 [Kingdonia uniflora]|uniref:Uncharacterized protein n=1 Tax=Kingdonia uniflora TaxID=39325 RepID=A0A7J7MXG6_9MAGN|nr:hypothetical protein GIB67_032288 [Kingdonia uniflora]